MKLEVGDRTINASTAGRPLDASRPLLVFLHGAGMDRTVWQLVTRFFSHHGHSVLAVDMPGHGRSDGPPLGTISEGAALIAHLIVAAGFEKATIVGHSKGALIGLELAGTQPGRIDRLVLMGVTPTMDVHPELLSAAKSNDRLAVDLLTSWVHGRRSHLGGHPTPGLWMLGSTNRLLERSADGVIHAGLAACHAYEDAESRATATNAPTLLLLGDVDVMTRPTAAAALAEMLPNSQTTLLPDTGHLAMVENPDGVIDAIAAFLEAHPSSG